MKTLDDCSEVVTGIYSAFKNGALYSGPLTILPDIQADMAYASSTNMGQYTAAYRWEIKPNDTDVGKHLCRTLPDCSPLQLLSGLQRPSV